MGQRNYKNIYSDLKTQQLMTVWSLNVGLLSHLTIDHSAWKIRSLFPTEHVFAVHLSSLVIVLEEKEIKIVDINVLDI